MTKPRALIKREYGAVIADLPEMCFVQHPTENIPVLVKRGVKGYWPLPHYDAAGWNERHGVTAAQERAMLTGSMFGFDVPGADPFNCED